MCPRTRLPVNRETPYGDDAMTFKTLSIFTTIVMVLVRGLTGCTSVEYVSADTLREPCVKAAKLKVAKHSGTCQLLEEISISDYRQAIAEGHAWIASAGLDEQQIIKIRQGQVWVGMLAEAARLSWGDPYYALAVAGTPRSQEQWVYSRGRRLYVTNGKITVIDYGFTEETPAKPNPIHDKVLDVL